MLGVKEKEIKNTEKATTSAHTHEVDFPAQQDVFCLRWKIFLRRNYTVPPSSFFFFFFIPFPCSVSFPFFFFLLLLSGIPTQNPIIHFLVRNQEPQGNVSKYRHTHKRKKFSFEQRQNKKVGNRIVFSFFFFSWNIETKDELFFLLQVRQVNGLRVGFGWGEKVKEKEKRGKPFYKDCY